MILCSLCSRLIKRELLSFHLTAYHRTIGFLLVMVSTASLAIICITFAEIIWQALTPQALRLLSQQVVALKSNPPEGVRITVSEEDFTAIEGWVQGPCA